MSLRRACASLKREVSPRSPRLGGDEPVVAPVVVAPVVAPAPAPRTPVFPDGFIDEDGTQARKRPRSWSPLPRNVKCSPSRPLRPAETSSPCGLGRGTECWIDPISRHFAGLLVQQHEIGMTRAMITEPLCCGLGSSVATHKAATFKRLGKRIDNYPPQICRRQIILRCATSP